MVGGRLAPRAAGVRTIFYLASSVVPGSAASRPDLVEADLAALAALVDALGERPVTVVVPSSGGTVYDPAAPPPYRETDPVAATTPYAHSRLAMERLVADHASRHPASAAVSLRISNAYGPGQRTGRGQGVVGSWLEAVAAGRTVTVYGDPATARDYVHVADVCHAFVRVHDLVEAGVPVPPVVNVASGEPVSLAELLAVVQAAVHPRVATVAWEARRSFDRSAVWLDPGLAATALGWRARVPLPEGVRSTWRALSAGHRSEPVA